MIAARAWEAAVGAQFSDDDACRYGPALETLAEGNDGNLTPPLIVEAARSLRSPLHDAFEWDDGAAAEHYRLTQARHLLRHVRIVEDDAVPQEAFYRVHISAQEAAYVSIDTVVATPSYREQVIQRALDELRKWRTRYQQYKADFGPVFAGIEAVEKKR